MRRPPRFSRSRDSIGEQPGTRRAAVRPMTDISVQPAAGIVAGGGDVGDYFALLKPRVMSLVVFTALVGMVAAPGALHPVLALDLAPRHRRSAPAPPALSTCGTTPTSTRRCAARRAVRSRPGCIDRDEALGFGVVLVGLLGASARPRLELARRRAARLHDLLLRRHLHDVAEALDGAEHRHRRRRRRAAPGRRLGSGDRRRIARAAHPLPHHLHVDAAAFLGARALHERRLRARRRARCCRTSPATRRRGGRSSSIRRILAPLGALPWLLGHAGPVYGVAALLLGAEFVRRAVVLLRRGDADRNSAAKALFGYSLVYLFALFAVRLAEAGAAGLIGG